jgi:hypothetical protein
MGGVDGVFFGVWGGVRRHRRRRVRYRAVLLFIADRERRERKTTSKRLAFGGQLAGPRCLSMLYCSASGEV